MASQVRKNSDTSSTGSRKGLNEAAQKSEMETLEPVLEDNENVASEIFDRPLEEGDFLEIPPKVYTLKEVYGGLTIESLNNAIYELGVVNLCWPEIEEPVFETRTCFPKSYYTNNDKERLLLAYAECFRRQYTYIFKDAIPLLFQAPNECGLQKMVCTSIRPTKLCYATTNTWQGVASLVADYFDYEPLTKPMLHEFASSDYEDPDRIMSPYTAIIRRSGNPFELAHVCVSWLIGAGYDAYVVVGCAKRDVCMAIRYRTVCPEIPDETEVIEEPPPPEEEPRYRLVPLPDFNSKYLKMMSDKEIAKMQKIADKMEAERIRKIEELEQPPFDSIDGYRCHGWVLVLPGQMGITEPFFIEPSEGLSYPIDTPHYQKLFSVYNNENYYVNLQKKRVYTEEEELLKEENPEEYPDIPTGVGYLNFDLGDLSCWEHLLAAEPFGRRMLIGVDYNDKRTAVDTDKHLDVPYSWVEKLEISVEDYEQRYPGSHKVVHFKKVLLEKFSPYSQRDGIIKRIKIYDDYALTVPLLTYEWYRHRVDKMYMTKTDHTEKTITEKFAKRGRKDCLIKHTYALDAPALSIEAYRTLEFNYFARLDHMTKVVCSALSFVEYFTDRADRLEDRVIDYTEATKQNPNRDLKTVTETYSRNPDLPSKKDIWKRIFHIQDNSIELLYHYDYNFVTNNTRTFEKPNLAESGGKILYFPDKTSGYVADPVAKQPRPLDVFYALCDHIDWEYRSTKHIRDMESDVIGYLKQRHQELTEPVLVVALFDTQKNEEAQKGWKEQELQKAEITEREKDAEIDPLAPYLARMFGVGHGIDRLTLKEAALIREQCINDFKDKQLARQMMVQERFDTLNTEYKEKRLWYLANQFILSSENEAAYFQLSADLSFKVHVLEVRLTRHMDLSAPRFKALEDYLAKHPLLKEYNKLRQQYGNRPMGMSASL